MKSIASIAEELDFAANWVLVVSVWTIASVVRATWWVT